MMENETLTGELGGNNKLLNWFAFLSVGWILLPLVFGAKILLFEYSHGLDKITAQGMVILPIVFAVISFAIYLSFRKKVPEKFRIPVFMPMCLSLLLGIFSLVIMIMTQDITYLNLFPPFPLFEMGLIPGSFLMASWVVPLINYLIIEKPNFSPLRKTDKSDELVLSKNPIVSYYQVWKIEREFKKAEIRFKHDYAQAQRNGTEPPKPPYYKLDDALKNYKRVFWVARIALLLIGGLGLIAYITEDGRKKFMSEVADTVHDKSCETADGIIKRWALGC